MRNNKRDTIIIEMRNDNYRNENNYTYQGQRY